MERIHIFVDGIGYYKDMNMAKQSPVPVSQGDGPVCITTFALTNLRDVEILEGYLKATIQELKERFKGGKNV